MPESSPVAGRRPARLPRPGYDLNTSAAASRSGRRRACIIQGRCETRRDRAERWVFYFAFYPVGASISCHCVQEVDCAMRVEGSGHMAMGCSLRRVFLIYPPGDPTLARNRDKGCAMLVYTFESERSHKSFRSSLLIACLSQGTMGSELFRLLQS